MNFSELIYFKPMTTDENWFGGYGKHICGASKTNQFLDMFY